MIKFKALKIYSIQKSMLDRGIESGGPVQKYIDSEVLRQSDSYIPMLTGELKNSGVKHTTIGAGEVIYKTPYARVQYYLNSGNGIEGSSNGGNRGKLWFERMKADHLDDILGGAAKVAGGKGKK